MGKEEWQEWRATTLELGNADLIPSEPTSFWRIGTGAWEAYWFAPEGHPLEDKYFCWKCIEMVPFPQQPLLHVTDDDAVICWR